MDNNLLRYIQNASKNGIAHEKIKESLVKAGWNEAIVDQALKSVANQENTKKPGINLQMWKGPIIIALILLILTNIYNYIYFGKFTSRSISESFAASAAFMLGTSFVLSSISYFFNFLDSKLAYRKEIGLLGYFLALSYTALLMRARPERYITGLPQNFISWDVLLGLSALIILTAMALVSINKVMTKITPAIGRKILRLGYLAYFFLILRATILQHDTWLKWFSDLNGLPPSRLVVAFFASFVIILRLTMALSIYFKNRSKVNAAEIVK